MCTLLQGITAWEGVRKVRKRDGEREMATKGVYTRESGTAQFSIIFFLYMKKYFHASSWSTHACACTETPDCVQAHKAALVRQALGSNPKYLPLSVSLTLSFIDLILVIIPSNVVKPDPPNLKISPCIYLHHHRPPATPLSLSENTSSKRIIIIV